MNEVTSRELLHNFSTIVARVGAGDQIVVTRHGKPVLMLAPVPREEPDFQARELLLRKALSVRMTRSLDPSSDGVDPDARGRDEFVA